MSSSKSTHPYERLKLVMRIKQSTIIKSLLILIAFISSSITILCGIKTLTYLDSYSIDTSSYTETSKFEQLYLKYAERAAVYVTYREKGYESDPSSIYYTSDLLSMLNGTARGNLRPSADVYTASQESFEYYNRLLNYDCKSFYYYVKNTTTGDYYYSPHFKDLIESSNNVTNETATSNKVDSANTTDTANIADTADIADTANTTDDKNITDATIEAYLDNISMFPAYLVINTQNDRYITNVNKSHYNIMNDTTISWIADFITNRNSISKVIDNPNFHIIDEDATEDSSLNFVLESEKDSTSNKETKKTNGSNEQSDARTNPKEQPEDDSEIQENEYVIYTFVLDTDVNGQDEFSTLKKDYETLRARFDTHFKYTIIAAVCLLLSLISLCFLVGHKKGIDGIYLNAFDKIYSEIAFCIICGSFVIVFIGLLYLRDFFSIQLLKPWLAVAYVICFVLGILGLTSLVKRIKARTLFKRSILYIICYRLFICSFRKLKHFLYSLPALFVNRHAAFRLLAIIMIFGLLQAWAYIFAHNSHLLYIFLVFVIFCLLALSLIKTFADMNLLLLGTKKIADGDLNAKMPLNRLSEPSKTIAAGINRIGDGLSSAVEEKLKSERLKTELITNVSHDIKTPLTSIINYVDLLNKENLENETAVGYLKILTEKSWRLKTLIEDLVEASKASSGTLNLTLERLNIIELTKQALGEFDDRFTANNLETILSISDENIHIYGDGRSTYRIIENLFSNVNKYALPNTRVYVDVTCNEQNAIIQIKNVSAGRLGISGDELMERFVRGDLSRHSEGSGLGLSIAKNLATLQNGNFDILLDGDLFKAIVTLPLYRNDNTL